MKVLFICTGNSARSQIAEALLRHLGQDQFEAFSAGTAPGTDVNPYALEVLREKGIDTRGLYPKRLDLFRDKWFDLVVTVCDHARQTCPFFPNARKIAHWSLPDPAAFEGSQFEILEKFRETRDNIERRIIQEILPLRH
ncbi:MAG: arsenate reductase ArsC [Candidatus Thorarchaeota archaeon]